MLMVPQFWAVLPLRAVAAVHPGEGDDARRLIHGDPRIELALQIAQSVVVGEDRRGPAAVAPLLSVAYIDLSVVHSR